MKSKKFITNGLENRIALNLINEASRMRYESAKKYIDFHANVNNNRVKKEKIVMIGPYNSGKTTFVNKLNDKYIIFHYLKPLLV